MPVLTSVPWSVMAMSALSARPTARKVVAVRAGLLIGGSSFLVSVVVSLHYSRDDPSLGGRWPGPLDAVMVLATRPLSLPRSRVAVQHLLRPRRNDPARPVRGHQFEGVDPGRQVEQLPAARPKRETAVQRFLASRRGLAHLAVGVHDLAFQFGDRAF